MYQQRDPWGVKAAKSCRKTGQKNRLLGNSGHRVNTVLLASHFRATLRYGVSSFREVMRTVMDIKTLSWEEDLNDPGIMHGRRKFRTEDDCLLVKENKLEQRLGEGRV